MKIKLKPPTFLLKDMEMENIETALFKKYLSNQTHKKYLLWIDDIRPIPNDYISTYHVIIAKSYKEAIIKLNSMKFDVICLDHDLGEAFTGYDICKYIIEHDIQCPEYRIHTSNIVGRQNMTQLLSRYTKSLIRQC